MLKDFICDCEGEDIKTTIKLSAGIQSLFKMHAAKTDFGLSQFILAWYGHCLNPTDVKFSQKSMSWKKPVLINMD